MPIVVVGAIAAGAAVSAGVAISTVAMVGMAATVVGKVTKFKELSQLGAGISLGAGIASVGQAVFGAGTAATGASATAGTAEAGSAALENTISSADLAGIDAAAGGVGGGASLPDAISVATSWDMPATAVESFSGAAADGASKATGLLGSSASAVPEAAAAVTPPAQQASLDVAGSTGAANPAAAAANTAVAPPPGTDTNSIARWWSTQSEGTKNRILQMGGNFAGGLFDGWSSEQKLALQREQQNLEMQKYNTMMANGSAQPKIAFQQYKPQATGLLGSAKG